MGFSLHPQLAADTVDVCDLPLTKVRLMNDSTYPWVILVPRQPNLREMHDLEPVDQRALMAEITHVSKVMQAHFKADKMNVAALGNMVPQLHVHIIARYEDDAAWPGPVWGKLPIVPYDQKDRKTLCLTLGALFAER